MLKNDTEKYYSCEMIKNVMIKIYKATILSVILYSI
jgi:hypothetical protein